MTVLSADSPIARRLRPIRSIKRGKHVRAIAIAAVCSATVLVLLTALVVSQAALAASGHDDRGRHGPDSPHGVQPESFGPDQDAPGLSPYEAADRARGKYGGRVLNVMLEHGPAGPYYRVKLLDGGRVRVVHVDADH